MKRIIVIFFLTLLCSAAFAGTPAEDLMNSIKDKKGVQVIEAKGFVMNFARGAIRKTPMKPLADQVTEVTVCKMEKASPEFIREFEAEAREIPVLWSKAWRRRTSGRDLRKLSRR